MTGEIQDVDRESFWREHQDTLVKIRDELASGKKSRSRYTPNGGIRKKTPNGVNAGRKLNEHPPYGKYRRTPSPYLPKLSPQPDQRGPSHLNGTLKSKKYDVVPPVKPRQAFVNTPKTNDYDSWGEESDDEEDDYEEEEEEADRNNNRKKRKPVRGGRGYKPQPYPSPMPAYAQPQVVYGAPFPTVYYPPPPQGSKKKKKYPGRKPGYKDIFNNRRNLATQSQIPVRSNKSRKKPPTHHSVPMFAAPMMPAMMMYPPPQEEDEDSDEDDMIKEAYEHFRAHPLFADDFVKWFINDCLDTELLPDFLIENLNDIKFMPYDHPLYLPSLYSCEDVLGDQISEMVEDLVREAVGEYADDVIDIDMLKRDPLEDFLSDVINEAVRQGTREVVRDTVVELAQDYLETEVAMGVLHNLVDDYLDDIAPELLEDTLFDIVAEDFLEAEVIIPEVGEEAEAVARETIQHYDTKIMRKELKEVAQQAQDKLAESIMMDYILTVLSQQGKLFTETDHYNKFLDDMILNIDMGQLFNVQRQRDKTLECKPLHKLHEKVVSDVALDVFLQQLTRSLDEDLADVDEYERGVNDGILQPIPLIVR